MSENEMAKSARIAPETLRKIASFEDAVAIARSMDGVIVDQILGDGFSPIEKDRLIGVKLVVMDWVFGVSDKHKDDEGKPAGFVTVRVVTSDNRKVFFSDGSGIYRQLKELENVQCIYVPRGLRDSVFEFVNEKGHEETGRSFYLNTAGTDA